jgi:hypothetical protein
MRINGKNKRNKNKKSECIDNYKKIRKKIYKEILKKIKIIKKRLFIANIFYLILFNKYIILEIIKYIINKIVNIIYIFFIRNQELAPKYIIKKGVNLEYKNKDGWNIKRDNFPNISVFHCVAENKRFPLRCRRQESSVKPLETLQKTHRA